MTVIDNLNDLSSLRLGSRSVLSIGVFDGVHSGHKFLIKQVQSNAKNTETNSIIVTFDQHPREFLNNTGVDFNLKILSNQSEKKHLINELNPDYLVILPFEEIFNLTPEVFVERVLVGILKIKKIIVGDDFHFGKHRLGNIAMLKSLAPKFDFEVEVVYRTKNSSDFISSTLVRNLLLDKKITLANQALGHSYLLKGVVCEDNDKILQVAIKNLHKLIPHLGLYEVKINSSETISMIELIKIENRDGWQVVTFKNSLSNYEIGGTISLSFLQEIKVI